jgi:hypothetical protein
MHSNMTVICNIHNTMYIYTHKEKKYMPSLHYDCVTAEINHICNIRHTDTIYTQSCPSSQLGNL